MLTAIKVPKYCLTIINPSVLNLTFALTLPEVSSTKLTHRHTKTQTMESKSSSIFFHFGLSSNPWTEDFDGTKQNMDRNLVSNFVSTSSLWIGFYPFWNMTLHPWGIKSWTTWGSCQNTSSEISPFRLVNPSLANLILQKVSSTNLTNKISAFYWKYPAIRGGAQKT